MAAVVIVANGEATTDPTEMGIETTLTEYLDAAVVSNNHRDQNTNDSNDKEEGEEASMQLLMREGRTGARRAGEEKCRGGKW